MLLGGADAARRITHDALGRVTLKDLPGSEPDVSFAYDNLGRVTSASQSGSSLTFTWDALGRKLTETGSHGTLTSTWDIGGRRTRLAHPDGAYFDHLYLVTGEMASITETLSAAASRSPAATAPRPAMPTMRCRGSSRWGTASRPPRRTI